MTDLIALSRTEIQREKRELTGVGLMIATVLMLLSFLLVFGITTLPHLHPVFLAIWFLFMTSSLVVGGIGLMNLIRGDFFKRLKHREARLVLMKAEQDRTKLSGDSVTTPLLSAPASITETTTRELGPGS